jgi:hypothetical protein
MEGRRQARQRIGKREDERRDSPINPKPPLRIGAPAVGAVVACILVLAYGLHPYGEREAETTRRVTRVTREGMWEKNERVCRRGYPISHLVSRISLPKKHSPVGPTKSPSSPSNDEKKKTLTTPRNNDRLRHGPRRRGGAAQRPIAPCTCRARGAGAGGGVVGGVGGGG